VQPIPATIHLALTWTPKWKTGSRFDDSGHVVAGPSMTAGVTQMGRGPRLYNSPLAIRDASSTRSITPSTSPYFPVSHQHNVPLTQSQDFRIRERPFPGPLQYFTLLLDPQLA
jgi:hypothetical protein